MSLASDDSATVYKPEFYRERQKWSGRSAGVIVPIVRQLTGCNSVIDVGCGTGTWLAAFGQSGAADLLGVDGEFVDLSQLEIDRSRFVPHDLRTPLKLDRTFDLAVCLEVAEHLPESAALPLVESLCALSNVVLFSAAVPEQGGVGHINLRWQSYWVGLFEQRRYVALDCIRPVVWHDQRVSYWYAQNALVYVQADYLAGLPPQSPLAAQPRPVLLDVVHPKRYRNLNDHLHKLEVKVFDPGAKEAISAAWGATRKAIVRRVWTKHTDTGDNAPAGANTRS